MREGTTYENDIGLWNSCDIEEIPKPTKAPQEEHLSEINSAVHIIFDLETTSLGTVI